MPRSRKLEDRVDRKQSNPWRGIGEDPARRTLAFIHNTNTGGKTHGNKQVYSRPKDPDSTEVNQD